MPLSPSFVDSGRASSDKNSRLSCVSVRKVGGNGGQGGKQSSANCRPQAVGACSEPISWTPPAAPAGVMPVGQCRTVRLATHFSDARTLDLGRLKRLSNSVLVASLSERKPLRWPARQPSSGQASASRNFSESLVISRAVFPGLQVLQQRENHI